MSRHGAWRILAGNLSEVERATIIKEVEIQREDFDAVLTALVRRGMEPRSQYCSHCGARLRHDMETAPLPF